MLYLILALLSSSLISVLMRLGNAHIKNNMMMFLWNYAICGFLSVVFMMEAGGIGAGADASVVVNPGGFFGGYQGGMGFAILLGAMSGIMYLVNFVLLQFNIRHNGMMMSSVFMKLGVLVPTLMAMVVFGDKPGFLQVLGFVMAIVAILIINIPSKSERADGNNGLTKALWLPILLLCAGFTDSLANIYEKVGSSALKDQYLLFTFAAACLISLLMAIKRKENFTIADLVWGFAIGVPNYFSARFLLLALGQLNAILVYPAINVGTILVVSACGIVFFKEKLNRKKALGFGLILVALVLLGL